MNVRIPYLFSCDEMLFVAPAKNLKKFENSNGFSVDQETLSSNQIFQYVTWNKLAEKVWFQEPVIYKKFLKMRSVMRMWQNNDKKYLHDVTV